MPRITRILCLLFLAFAAYAQVDMSNCVYNGLTYTYDNNSVELRCSNYTCGTFNAFDCSYAGSDYSDDCDYAYSKLSISGTYGLYNTTYYSCPQDTFPGTIGFGSPVRNSSDPNLSNCTNLGWTTNSNYSCLQYNCNLTNGTTYIRSQCVPRNYSCTYYNNITNNYYTCSPYIYNSTCVYSGTTMFDNSEDSDDSYSCNNYNCAYDNQTQFTNSNCTYANTTTGGCTYWNTTYYPSHYQCSLYNCNFSNGTQYYKTDYCYYSGSNYSQDCTYINTNAKYSVSTTQPTTGICLNYNCLNNDTNITTSKNCTYVTAIDYDNCNYINTTTETQVSSQATAVFSCENYQCTANSSSYVFPYCTLTDPVCVTSTTMNTSVICQTTQCQFSNGTLYASQPDCLGINCVILNSTNNGTYTCTNYNCSGNSIVTSNCEPNTPSDQQVCTFLNITTNSTYNCTNYNCTFSNTFSIVSNCQELQNNNQSNGTTGNTGNTGNTGDGNTNTGSNGGTGNSGDSGNSGNTGNTGGGNTNTGSSGDTGNSGNTGNTGNTGNGSGTSNQGTGGSQTDSGAGTTSQVSDSSGSSGSSTGIIVGCVLGVAVIAVGGFVWYKFRLAKRAAHNEAGLSTELGTTGFSSNVTQLRVAL